MKSFSIVQESSCIVSAHEKFSVVTKEFMSGN